MVPIPRRLVPFLGLLVTLALLTVTHYTYYPDSPLRSFLPFGASPSAALRSEANALLSGTHVAVVDQEYFHDEVHGAVVHALNSFADVRTTLYRPGWRWNFDKTIASWWSTAPKDPKTFLDDLRADTSIRHIFLPTTDFSGRDWDNFQPKLKEIWLARAPEHRFSIIGIRHWGKYDLTRSSAWWAERDAVSFMTIGEHVTHWITAAKNKHAAENKAFTPAEKDGLTRMRIETFVPIFKPDFFEHHDPAEAGYIDENKDTLDMALIQSGSYDEGHRGMSAIFDELTRDIKADPGIWGYHIVDGKIIPDPNLKSRFTLKILGFGAPSFPPELEHVVVLERQLPYREYYDHVHGADLVLPAFGKDSYDENRGSSTMGVAASAMTPLLVSETTAKAYGWFCPAFAVLRHDEMTEIEYIRQVRAGLIPWRRRRDIKADLTQCQYDWTTQNMHSLATLFATAPFRPHAAEENAVNEAEELVEEVIEAEIRIPGE